MSTPAHTEEPPQGSRPMPPGRTPGVPAPPGGHALRIDPLATRIAQPSSTIPVVEEVSAGGLVVREVDGRPQAAVIARRNRAGRLEWCLPKGHLEGVETPEEAAVREIAEETGIEGVVESPLGIIDYWFSGEDRRVHKVVHHFLLRATGGTLSVEGDPDGEAEDAAWVDVAELHERLSYPNERRLAHLAHDVLHGDRRMRGTYERRITRTTLRTVDTIPLIPPASSAMPPQDTAPGGSANRS